MTRRRLLLVVAAVVVLVAATLVVVLRRGDDAQPGGVASDEMVTIDVGDVTLAAEVVTPKGVARPPLVVMPASWGQAATEYTAVARHLADSGFLVVAYAQRGFGTSGGQIDFAGAATQADAGKVIDWALRATKADPAKIGMYGISYGAGISLLTAARDPRVKAVAALSTWTDLGTSFDPGGTSATRALAGLIASAPAGRLAPEIRRLQTLLRTDPAAVGAAMRALSPSRSPQNYVAQLNRNKPAIMMANSFGDSLFPPSQLTTFFDALTTPKRLQLAAGDHGTRDVAGLRDGRSGTAGDAAAWLAHYLRGVDNGIDTEAPVVLTDEASGSLLTLRSLDPRSPRTIALGRPNTTGQASSSPSAWRASMLTGTDTVATSGAQVNPFGTYETPTADLLKLDRSRELAWSAAVGDDPLTIAGAPRATFDVAANRSSATVVGYLYDYAGTGNARLMSVQPLSLRGLRAGRATAVTLTLQPVAWTVPAGHAVVLVVDTVDPRYTGLNRAGTVITMSSAAARPARLTLPVVGS